MSQELPRFEGANPQAQSMGQYHQGRPHSKR